ncbi:MAG TPA: flotillin family protein, partial [Acidimicrobiia bacterium]|nr:flotillin family protein [Acidimicrobiia bacterium]
MSAEFILGGIVGAVVLLIILFKMMWRVAEPNEALIVSGLREHTPSDAVSESLGFKITTGKGTFIV